MASSTNGATGSNSDATRYQNYLSQLERQQDATIQDVQEQHKDKLSHLVDGNNRQQTQMEKDYDIQISNEAESLGKKLALTREKNELAIAQERERGEKEAEQIKAQYQQKIEIEKKTGDEQLTKLQNYYKKAADELHRQFTKEQTRETQKGKMS